jgi:L-alanine-DL-glutamate epimerase-like enolase superfamily enzyme
MRIERLEIVPYALPFREPYVTARGRLERREMLLVRLWADDGTIGVGEAVPLSLRGGPGLAQIAGELAGVVRVLAEGEPVGWNRRAALIKDCMRAEVPSPAVAAIDMATLDLVGKQLGRPAWELLGVEQPRPVVCNATLVAGAPDAVAENARAWAGRGFETFKLKAGVDGDVEQLAAVREAVGAGARIRVDANGTWSADEARRRLEAMAASELELAEQPVATLEEMVELRSAVSVPLAADESVNDAFEARRAARLGACDSATVKLSKVGGVDAALAVAEELPVYLSSALDGPVGIAAAVHAAQALRERGGDAGVAHGLATAELFDGTIAWQHCVLDGDELFPPDAPGLGVEIDENELERHRIGLVG